MARRPRQTNFEVLVEIAALLPWWAAVLLALFSYLLLHHFATRVEVVPTDPKLMASYMMPMVYKAVATYAQYVVPFFLVLGAGLSFFRAKKTQKRYDETKALRGKAPLLSMSWQEFEELVGEYFRRQGYSVRVNGGGGPDGGVDVIATKNGETFLIQCKQWRAYKVGVDVVRQLYGVMTAQGAVGGFVVSAGEFTNEAKEFASGRNIEWLDGERLMTAINRSTSPTRAATPKQKPTVEAPSVLCPQCKGPMVKRVAKQGANAGQAFWGCSAYPRCRGTRAL